MNIILSMAFIDFILSMYYTKHGLILAYNPSIILLKKNPKHIMAYTSKNPNNTMHTSPFLIMVGNFIPRCDAGSFGEDTVMDK